MENFTPLLNSALSDLCVVFVIMHYYRPKRSSSLLTESDYGKRVVCRAVITVNVFLYGFLHEIISGYVNMLHY